MGDMYEIDAAFLPIGDNFTMGPEDALVAAGLLRPRIVVPIHYNTFDVISQDPILLKGCGREYQQRLLRAGPRTGDSFELNLAAGNKNKKIKNKTEGLDPLFYFRLSRR